MSPRARIFVAVLLLLLAVFALYLWRGNQADPAHGGLRILYLAWDEAEQPQLFLAAVGVEGGQQLTAASEGVRDYQAGPAGERIVFSTARADGGADIWLVNVDGSDERRLLACPEARCSGPVWRPDGQLLLYERRELRAADASPGPPRLFWLDPTTGESVSVFREAEASGHLPSFSADGRWLAYIAPAQLQLRVVNVESNQILVMANELGERPVWHPERNLLLFTEVRLFEGEQFVTHIYRADLPDESELPPESAFPEEAITNLSGQVGFDDGAPTWAPDGERLAFGRKLPRTPTGRQLWLMAGDGSNQRPLTEAVSLQFSRPRWSPVGDQLLVQRFDVQAPSEPPGIWLLEVETGTLEEVATPGFQATWLP